MMFSSIRVLGMAMMVVVCASQPTAGSTSALDGLNLPFAEQCEPSLSVLACATFIEQHTLVDTDGAVRHDESGFCVTTSSTPICLEDSADLKHFFIGETIGHFLVLELWMPSESELFSTVLMIPPSGSTPFRLLSYPVVSPDGRYVATASYDIDAGFRPNVVQVWSLTNAEQAAFVLESFEVGFGPRSVSWSGSRNIRVELESIEGRFRSVDVNLSDSESPSDK